MLRSSIAFSHSAGSWSTRFWWDGPDVCEPSFFRCRRALVRLGLIRTHRDETLKRICAVCCQSFHSSDVHTCRTWRAHSLLRQWRSLFEAAQRLVGSRSQQVRCWYVQAAGIDILPAAYMLSVALWSAGFDIAYWFTAGQLTNNPCCWATAVWPKSELLTGSKLHFTCCSHCCYPPPEFKTCFIVSRIMNNIPLEPLRPMV